jgi:hypothetical protein
MDYASVLKKEIFRPAVTLLIPGIVAAFPFCFITVHYFPDLWHFVIYYSNLAAVLSFLISVAFGLIAQEFGAQFEAKVIDVRLNQKNPEHLENWYRYLRCTFPVEPVGQGYIGNLVLLLKFELNLASALAVCWLGLLWLSVVKTTFSGDVFAWTTAAFFVAIVYLLYESFCTAENLARVRKELLKDVESPPLDKMT